MPLQGSTDSFPLHHSQSFSPVSSGRVLSPRGSGRGPQYPSIQQSTTISSQSQSFISSTENILRVNPPALERPPSLIPLGPEYDSPHYLERPHSFDGQSPLSTSQQRFFSGEFGTQPTERAPFFPRASSGTSETFSAFSDTFKKDPRYQTSSAPSTTRTISHAPSEGQRLTGIVPFGSSNYLHLLLQVLYYIPNLRHRLYRIYADNGDEIIPNLLSAMTRLQHANHERLPRIPAFPDIGPLYEKYLEAQYGDAESI